MLNQKSIHFHLTHVETLDEDLAPDMAIRIFRTLMATCCYLGWKNLPYCTPEWDVVRGDLSRTRLTAKNIRWLRGSQYKLLYGTPLCKLWMVFYKEPKNPAWFFFRLVVVPIFSVDEFLNNIGPPPCCCESGFDMKIWQEYVDFPACGEERDFLMRSILDI